MIKANKFKPQQHLNNYNDTKTPVVFITLPTYNRSELLQQTINMILAQTLKTWILLLIDDGSLDGHKYVFRKLKGKYVNDDRLIFVENEHNCKIAKTINRGIEYFLQRVDDDYIYGYNIDKSYYFTWISDDNDYYPIYLKQLTSVQADFSYSSFQMNNILNPTKSGIINKQYKNKIDLLNNFQGLGSYMWSENAIRKIGYYNTHPEINGLEDFDYLVRTFNQFEKEEIKYIYNILMGYNRHESSGFHTQYYDIMKRKEEYCHNQKHTY